MSKPVRVSRLIAEKLQIGYRVSTVTITEWKQRVLTLRIPKRYFLLINVFSGHWGPCLHLKWHEYDQPIGKLAATRAKAVIVD